LNPPPLTSRSSAHAAWSSLSDRCDILTPTSTSRAGFLAECASGAFDACQAAYRTFDSVAVTGPIDAALVAALPASLRFICHNGAGYDQVDVAACTARGIRVSNTPSAVDDATADTAIFLLLGALRNFNAGLAGLRDGRWRGAAAADSLTLGADPQGKVLGILGMGGIGQNMARKARRAFGMTVRYHNRTRLAAEQEQAIGAEHVGFEKLLAESDVLSLNLPLNVSLAVSSFPPPPSPVFFVPFFTSIHITHTVRKPPF